MADKFAVFILTHGRPHRVITYNTLRRQGYTGDIYIIVDNEDATIDEYRANYGDKVIVFDKLAISKTFDTGDNFNDRRAVIYARNACWGIAWELGLDYFLQLDDDYSSWWYKFDAELKYSFRGTQRLDELFSIVLAFYKAIPALSIAFAQGGDAPGGEKCTNLKTIRTKRKVMNSFFCDVARPFQFFGRINEDVNTYVAAGNRGSLFLSFFNAILNQESTQHNPGGMTELYLDSGTYIKSFYTVMYAPSCVTVYQTQNSAHERLHHLINWPNAVPCILSENCRRVQP